VNYKEMLQNSLPGWNGRLAAHHVSYLGDGHVHRAVPYNPLDPKVVATKLALMQSVGIDVVISTWQGIYAPESNSDTILMAKMCAEVGMQHALLLDPWCAKLGPPNGVVTAPSTQNVIDSLSASSAILNASSYVPEKFILDFNTGANLGTLAKQFPQYDFLAQGAGFSWISIPPNLTPDNPACNAASVANLKSQHSNPAMKVASFCMGFNDAGMPLPANVQSMTAFLAAGGKRDWTQSVWGGPARILYSYEGEFAQQQIATIPPNVPIVALVTWDDVDECTAIEPKVAEAAGVNWATL